MKKLEEELAMVEEVERRSDGHLIQSGDIWCVLCLYDVSGDGRTAMRGSWFR